MDWFFSPEADFTANFSSRKPNLGRRISGSVSQVRFSFFDQSLAGGR